VNVNKFHFWWLLVLCSLFFVAGLMELVALNTDKPGAEQVWNWLLGIPFGGLGILWVAKELKIR
jgi:hypothetical protein